MFIITMIMIVTLEYLYSTSSTFPSFVVRKYVAEECDADRALEMNSRDSDKTRQGQNFVQKILNKDNKLYAHGDHEIRHIGFLKVHKAASSTLQNIFFRFGYERNLSFVFTTDPNYFSRQRKGHYPVLAPKNRQVHDILCNHGIFNYDTYSSVLHNDSVYLAVVRDPLELFVSAVNYYTQTEMYLSYLRDVPGNKVQNLIRNTTKYDSNLFSYTRNLMARDLGFPPTASSKNLDKHLELLESKLKLVLLVEHFEESLILMKRYLNWKLQDILYIPNNVFGKGYTVTDLTATDIDLFNVRNRLDVVIYNYFYARFWRQFNAESSEIHLEVLNYKLVLKKVSSFCKNNYKPKKKVSKPNKGKAEDSVEELGLLIIPETPWNDKFVVTLEDCKYMLMKELDFIAMLRKIQGSEILPSKINTGQHMTQSKYQRIMLQKDLRVPEKYKGDKLDSKKYYRGWRIPVLRNKFRKEYKLGVIPNVDQRQYYV